MCSEPSCSSGCSSASHGEEAEKDEHTAGGPSPHSCGGHDPYNTDPGCWGNPNTVDDKVQVYWARMGPELCQNQQSDLSASERQYTHQRRFFSRALFQRKLCNGEYLPRKWLCYSPSKGTVFCFACKHFGHSKVRPPFGSVGFSNWKHASERIAEHESCEMHRKAMIVYINKTANQGTVDSELKKTVN